MERLDARQFKQFREFIYEQSGIRFDEKKLTLLSNRIRRRLRDGGFPDFDAYLKHLKSPGSQAELAKMLDAVTTNETFFFRTAKHFDWIRESLITECVNEARAGRRTRSLRFFSAGCADGAEPYSIAICLAENMYRLRDWKVSVLGADISQEVLDSAALGRYRKRSIEGVSEKQLRRYFRSVDDEFWEIRAEIKELVEFKKHNLMQPLRAANFDCVFIRNVLIYFDSASKQTVLQHLLDRLNVGGYLVIGPSEGIYDYLAPLRRVSPLIYQKAPGGEQDHAARVTPRGAER